MSTEKRKWVCPEIRVLVRGESEETVLSGCKGQGIGVGGPNENWICTSPGQGNSQEFCYIQNHS